MDGESQKRSPDRRYYVKLGKLNPRHLHFHSELSQYPQLNHYDSVPESRLFEVTEMPEQKEPC